MTARQPPFETLEGVNVHRIQRRERNERNKFAYLYRLLKFCVKSSFVLSRLHWKRRYDLIHVHNVPDFLVFSAWLPKATGAKIILDIHDILPEFFANKFRKPENSLYVRLLKLIEKFPPALPTTSSFQTTCGPKKRRPVPSPGKSVRFLSITLT